MRRNDLQGGENRISREFVFVVHRALVEEVTTYTKTNQIQESLNL